MRRRLLIMAAVTTAVLGSLSVPALADQRTPSTVVPASCVGRHGTTAFCTVRGAGPNGSRLAITRQMKQQLVQTAQARLAGPRAAASATSVTNDCIEGPEGVWYQSRTQVCMFDVSTLYYIIVPTGQVVGASTYLGAHFAFSDAGSSNWGETDIMTVAVTTGDTALLSIGGSYSCSTCDVTSQRFPVQSIAVVGQQAVGMATFRTRVTAPGAVDTATTSLFSKSPLPPDPGVTVTVPGLRCDNLIGGRPVGCVFPGAPPPVFPAATSNSYPEFARHVRDALNSGLPGSPSSGRPLHRLMNPTLQDANRRTAHCGSNPFNPPDPLIFTCDEYPFASTYEGAAFQRNAGFSARTFPWCGIPGVPQISGANGWSVCWIFRGDNSGAGGALGAFYSDNRLIDTEPFYVEIP